MNYFVIYIMFLIVYIAFICILYYQCTHYV